jgi:hypothetical protein
MKSVSVFLIVASLIFGSGCEVSKIQEKGADRISVESERGDDRVLVKSEGSLLDWVKGHQLSFVKKYYNEKLVECHSWEDQRYKVNHERARMIVLNEKCLQETNEVFGSRFKYRDHLYRFQQEGCSGRLIDHKFEGCSCNRCK